MDNFYMNISSQNQSYDWTNSTTNSNRAPFELFITYVMTCITICLGVPLSLLAIYSLHTQVSSDHVAPIYVINLLVSDILQFCCMIVDVVPHTDSIFFIFLNIYLYSLMVSVGFMVCVALERYLLIVHPLWYRCRRTIKSTVVVCVLVWLISIVPILPGQLNNDFKATSVIFGVFFLLPFPLFIFFLVATVKALSASISVSSEEKRRIVGVLVLVLLIYTLLFLPIIMLFLTEEHKQHMFALSFMFLTLSPLADLVLYVFMRKGAVDKLLTAVCCC